MTTNKAAYKVLIPVTNQPDLVKEKIELVEDKSKLILINNFDNEEVASLCNEAENNGAEVHNYPEQLGVAASWNIGLKKLEQDCDLIVILSTSICFDKPFESLLDEISKYEKRKPAGMYYCNSDLHFHCFVITRQGLEVNGYFDENFWPIYLEDRDYRYRAGLNKLVIVSLNETGIAHSHGGSLAIKKDSRLMNHQLANSNRTYPYYKAKWGGMTGQEVFTRPFNNITLDVNTWTVERDDSWITLKEK